MLMCQNKFLNSFIIFYKRVNTNTMLIKTLSIVSLSLLIVSCGDQSEAIENSLDEVVNEMEEDLEEEISDEVLEVSQYEIDWESLKEAISKGDVDAINSMVSGDEFDVDMFLMVMHDLVLFGKMKATAFFELSTTDVNGTDQLEFSAEESSIDEDGNEVGSAIMIYLSKGETNLKLDSFVAAG